MKLSIRLAPRKHPPGNRFATMAIVAACVTFWSGASPVRAADATAPTSLMTDRGPMFVRADGRIKCVEYTDCSPDTYTAENRIAGLWPNATADDRRDCMQSRQQVMIAACLMIKVAAAHNWPDILQRPSQVEAMVIEQTVQWWNDATPVVRAKCDAKSDTLVKMFHCLNDAWLYATPPRADSKK